MSANSRIEWTDATWTPIRARVKENAADIAREKGYESLVQIAAEMTGRVGPHCERISAGCGDSTGGGCYSEANNSRCLPSNGTGLPFDRRARDLVDTIVDEKMLEAPLHWKKTRRIFVCSQTDLFGEWVPDEAIDRVFAVMALCPQHTFQVLTKRADRMRKWASEGINVRQRVETIAQNIWWAQRRRVQEDASFTPLTNPEHWPLPNVWLGVSCEDQETADERIPLLLYTPAAVRFVSAEPLLGPIDFRRHVGGSDTVETDLEPAEAYCIRCGCRWNEDGATHKCPPGFGPTLDWVIVGGESGPGARPMHPQWVRDIRDQCQAAGVPFFFKQWGHHMHYGYDLSPSLPPPSMLLGDGTAMYPVGKKASGRLLDGREWNEFPAVWNSCDKVNG